LRVEGLPFKFSLRHATARVCRRDEMDAQEMTNTLKAMSKLAENGVGLCELISACP
jgi:hypothetical protein